MRLLDHLVLGDASRWVSLRERGAWCVFVVKDGRLEKRTVNLRSYGPRESAVQAGVDEHEDVVVQPSESLELGARVRVRAAQTR